MKINARGSGVTGTTFFQTLFLNVMHSMIHCEPKSQDSQTKCLNASLFAHFKIHSV